MENWETELHEAINRRNLEEFESLKYIYSQHESLQRKYRRLHDQADNFRHKLYILEHEVGAIMSKGDQNGAMHHAKKGFELLHSELSAYEDHPKINLSKVVYDQKVLLANQNEEILLSKEELQRAMLQIADLTEELKNVRKDPGTSSSEAVSDNPTVATEHARTISR